MKEKEGSFFKLSRAMFLHGMGLPDRVALASAVPEYMNSLTCCFFF